MRHYLRPSLSLLGLLLALASSSIFVAHAAYSDAAVPASDRVSSAESPQPPPAGAAGEKEGVRQSYARLPLSFEANRGQADARVQFLARNSAYSLYLMSDEVALALRGPAGRQHAQSPAGRAASVVRLKLLGANARPRAYGLEELEGKSNYLVGGDPARWRTGVPNYARVKYEGVYPGVDVVYCGTQRQLEYDFLVAPGADAGLIRLRVEGAHRARVEPGGDLVLPTAAGELRQHAPLAYQEVEGARRAVSCRYVLRGGNRVGFELGAYDRSLPLVIDPVIGYSTFLGGSGYDEGYAIAVDAQGNAYLTGRVASYDFPVTPGAYQPNYRGGNEDVFVSKLNADGTGLVYSTYLGGGSSDVGTSIAVDGAGQAHVAGTAGAWYEWDVTDYVRGELAAGRPTVSFVLKGASTTNYQVTFNSREAAGTNAPSLAVTTP